jgi:hypothetical protein
MRRFAAACLLLSACHRTESVVSAPAPEAAAPSTASQSADPTVLSDTPETMSQISPALVITPKGGMAIAWTGRHEGRRTSVGVRFSNDHGETWTNVELVPTPDSRQASDPALATDADGNVYLAWVGTGEDGPGGTPDSHVYVARVPAGTSQIEPAVDVSDTMHRGSRLSAPTLATAAGAVVVSWAYTSPGGDGVAFARSDGKRWTKGVVIERIDLRASHPRVCTSAAGDRVWVAYLDSEAGVRIRSSDDGGASWSSARVATVSTPSEHPLLADVAPVCVADADSVTVAYGVAKVPDDRMAESIQVAKSYDGGRTFDARRVAESSGRVLAPQMVREAQGAVDIAYYAAGAADGGEAAGSLRWVRATDDKSAFGPSRLARANFRFPAPSDAAWPGTTFGLAWQDGTLYAASVDNSSAAPHVALTRIPIH